MFYFNSDNILTGFIKKDYPEAELYNINNLENLEGVIGG